MNNMIVFKKDINDHEVIYGEKRLADYLNTTITEVKKLISLGKIDFFHFQGKRFKYFKKQDIDLKLKGKARYTN